jgi:hypothetical protein
MWAGRTTGSLRHRHPQKRLLNLGHRNGADQSTAFVTDQSGLIPSLDHDQATATLLVAYVGMRNDGKILRFHFRIHAPSSPSIAWRSLTQKSCHRDILAGSDSIIPLAEQQSNDGWREPVEVESTNEVARALSVAKRCSRIVPDPVSLLS